MEFVIGEKVWVYQFGCPPVVGTVSEIFDTEIKVKLDRRSRPNSAYAKADVYHCPGDKTKLIDTIRDEAADLEGFARALEGEIGDKVKVLHENMPDEFEHSLQHWVNEGYEIKAVTMAPFSASCEGTGHYVATLIRKGKNNGI